MKQRCRCCLSTNADSYYDIFEQHKSGTTYAENIRYLAEVQIERDDGLPQQMCCICCDKIHHIYEFGLSVRIADEKLRQEIETAKNQSEDEDQMDSMQVLENEYFAQVDENDLQVCVIEEVLDQETEQESVIMEEIHDVEEINIVEDILDLDRSTDLRNEKEKVSYNLKEDLLASLAQVASTQENVSIIKSCSVNEEACFPEDEIDENYLIEYNPNETNDFKPPKWKCGECKVILRGDVSYEGHMNIHKQLRPNECTQCQTKFRCRAALKRHKNLRHALHTNTKEVNNTDRLCMECKMNFFSETDFNLHEIMVHNLHKKCPFCQYSNDDNLKEHIRSVHATECNVTDQISSQKIMPKYQCYRCSKTFEEQSLFKCHNELCHKVDDNLLKENNVTIQPINMESEASVQCEICKRKLLKKNLNKHMELHKRKRSKNLEETKNYLCAFCPREFKNSKSLHQHEKIHQGECSDVVYVCGDCDRQYASQYLLETHRKQAHKERDNICLICGNAFKLKNQLVNHMKLHLEKNIPCPHCDKKYARRFDLNVHLRSHTGEQPYACHLCEKRFAIKVRLTYHLQKHYGIKHHCKECGAEFNSKQKLKAHSFKHTGMPYRCELCDDHGFATRNAFKRHLNRVHHATISEESLNEMFQRNTGKTVKIKQISNHGFVQTSDDENENRRKILDVLEK